VLKKILYYMLTTAPFVLLLTVYPTSAKVEGSDEHKTPVNRSILYSANNDNPDPSKVELRIWDETDDMDYGGKVRFVGDTVDFYVFYGYDKSPLHEECIKCEIMAGSATKEMRFDKELGLYRLSKKIEKPGTFKWSVRCGGGKFPTIEKTDDIEILSLKEDLYLQLVHFKKVFDFENNYQQHKKEGAYPRLLNHFMISGWMLDDDYRGINLNDELAYALSRWDIVAPSIYNIKKFNLEEHLQISRSIKKLNPKVKLLMYIPMGNFPMDSEGLFSDDIVKKLTAEGWLALAPSGATFSPPSAWKLVQYTRGSSAEYISDFITSRMNEFTLFDGVWLDLVRGERTIRGWFEKDGMEIDLDRDGISDSSQHSVKWTVNEIQRGYADVIKKLRVHLGDDKLIICNPGVPWEVNEEFDDSEMFQFSNGNMQEGAEGVDWVIESGVRGALLNAKLAYDKPERLFVICLENTDPDRLSRRNMRYALTMTLMTDAYFSYDSYDVINGGHRYHNQIYWWPEYNADLGFPRSSHSIKKDTKGREYYFRIFDKGVVAANSSKKPVTVNLDAKYRDVSTGTVSDSFVIKPKDGKILLSHQKR